MSGFMEDSWILVTASVFNILKCVVLFEQYEESLTSRRFVVEKERGILIALRIIVDILLWYYTKTWQVVIS